MKSELLSALATIASSVDALSAQVNALPDDPITAPLAPAPNAPAGMNVTNAYVVGGPLAIGIGWQPGPSGSIEDLSFKGAVGNPNGPDDWTSAPTSGSEGADGERYTHVLQNPAGQVIEFRLRFSLSGQAGEYSYLTVTADDCPQ